jgi:hypothetical protein
VQRELKEKEHNLFVVQNFFCYHDRPSPDQSATSSGDTMDFKSFFEKCQNESTVGDFESYLSYCIFEKEKGRVDWTLEKYSQLRTLAFERRDENAAQVLFETARASEWKDGEWDGALR